MPRRCRSNRNVINAGAGRRRPRPAKQKEYTVPEDVVLTLDMITDPNK